MNEALSREATRLGVPNRLALLQEGERSERLRAEGVISITPFLSTVVMLEGMATYPGIFGLLTEAKGDKRIAEVVVRNPLLCGHALRDVGWPGNVLVLSIQRDGEVLVPHGSTNLRAGDVLTLIGSDECIREAVSRATA